MRLFFFVGVGIVTLGLLGLYFVHDNGMSSSDFMPLPPSAEVVKNTETEPIGTKTAMFAGGCFWCVEADLEKAVGVVSVVSGYAGGTNENPTYENYDEAGHREVVLVNYDPAKTSYRNLVWYLITHIDPTDAGGSFHDRGHAYTSAVYFEGKEEKFIAEAVIAGINETHAYDVPIVTAIEQRQQFWPAEEYHQDYYKKNELKYNFYRTASGRDAFIKAHPVPKVEEAIQKETTAVTSIKERMKDFKKPTEEELKKMLTPEQFKVTQEDKTEKPFENEYDKNYADGIYVDVISGEPLYSSKDKYDSGSGWPSFTKPISLDAVTTKEDNFLWQPRTEVR